MAAALIGLATLLVLVVGPLLAAVTGVLRTRRAPVDGNTPVAWNWRRSISSGLLYVLAFNLTFFIQELFLVVPKAFVPGLRPTLFHNNHQWEGEHPLASLLQGTGALAIVVSAVTCALLLRRRTHGPTATLFLIWMTFNGFFQALPQVVTGARHPSGDVGMAMRYLGLGEGARTFAAIVALASIPPIAWWLARGFLATADDQAHIASRQARARFIFRIATMPALAAVPLIIAFRVPRELVEVVAPPVVVAIIGMGWVQAWARHVGGVTARGRGATASVALLSGAVLALLFAFQVLLRPGVRFY